MKFRKKALTVSEQITQLEIRGMVFSDKDKAAHYLSHISYYRLSAYWYTFLKNPKSDHLFKENTTFDAVLNTYVFDRKLRLLIFDEIERIEIALRTQIIYHFCHEYGSNWYEEKYLFRKPSYFFKFNELLNEEFKKSSEVFIKHYKRKYTDPINPPAWMALELASLGQLSMLYKNLKSCSSKKAIADHFGLHENVLESWLESLSYVRNICAHHSRLWNKKLTKAPIIPKTTKYSFLEIYPKPEKNNSIYVIITSVKYLLNIIIPSTSYFEKIEVLLNEHPGIPLDYMGFPNKWKEDKLWE